jgi:hypothetical protein
MCTALVSLGLSDSVTHKRLDRVHYWAIMYSFTYSLLILIIVAFNFLDVFDKLFY